MGMITVLGEVPRENGTKFVHVVCSRRMKIGYHALYDINNNMPERIEASKRKLRLEMVQF